MPQLSNRKRKRVQKGEGYMKVIDILEVVNESRKVEIITTDTQRILAVYDGRNSIPSRFNKLNVVQLDVEENAIQIFIEI